MGRAFPGSLPGKPAWQPLGAAWAAACYRRARLSELARRSAGLRSGGCPELSGPDPGRRGLGHPPFISGTGRPGAAAATGAGAWGHGEPGALGAGVPPGGGAFGRAERGGAASNGGFTQPDPWTAAPGGATQHRGGLAALRLAFGGGGLAALGVSLSRTIKGPGWGGYDKLGFEAGLCYTARNHPTKGF